MNKKNLILFGVSYFFVLFNYPFIRASSSTLFFESYGAKSSPSAWFIAIILLTIFISIANKLQSIKGFQFSFLVVSSLSVFFSLVCILLAQLGWKLGIFALFAWKEVYIVLQVHLLLAYVNSWLDRSAFIKLIGPIGAIGSLGGILGGLSTSFVANGWGSYAVFFVGQFFVFISALTGFKLQRIIPKETLQKSSPFQSLDTKEIKQYVLLIAFIIALSQIVINIADFQFSVFFEQMIQDQTQRTVNLGHVYTATNALTLFIQILLIPVLLRILSNRAIHLLIPISYLFCVALGFSGGSFLLSASFYIYFKASDYSIFSAAKELLYHPLAPIQKYGAKYFTDMFIYRSSKAIVAGVLIYFQDAEMLRWITIVSLALWILTILLLFKNQKTYFKDKL